MMHKVLLIGKNKVMIEDLFSHSNDDEFELQTSSMRYKDIVSHLKHFRPDAIYFCMHQEEKERMDVVASLRQVLEESCVAFVLIGDQEECDDFKNAYGGMGDLILKKPISARSINEKTAPFLEERKAFQKQDPLQSASDIADELMGKISQDKTLKKIANKVEQEEKDLLKAGIVKAENPVLKQHILVVDDDPMMLKLIKEQLKDNYTVATAVNGAIALKFLETRSTDLILLDYEMPGQNGAQILEKIRNNPTMAKLPVIFLTGMKDKDKIQQVVQMKPQGYLLKPIEREALINSIKRVIG